MAGSKLVKNTHPQPNSPYKNPTQPKSAITLHRGDENLIPIQKVICKGNSMRRHKISFPSVMFSKSDEQRLLIFPMRFALSLFGGAALAFTGERASCSTRVVVLVEGSSLAGGATEGSSSDSSVGSSGSCFNRILSECSKMSCVRIASA